MGPNRAHLSSPIIAYLGALPLLAGCVGSARPVLKGPIEDQCMSAGLNGCDEIAEGATLYADENEVEGEQELLPALHANGAKAAELKRFADSLEHVGMTLGGGRYLAPLQPAIRLVQRSAADAAARQPRTQKPSPDPADAEKHLASTAPRQEPVPLVHKPDPVANPWPVPPPPAPVSRFFWVAGSGAASPCRFPGSPKMLCLREVANEAQIVSDVMVSAACPVDVVVASGQALDFDWMVYAPAGRGAEVHGAMLPLQSKHEFTVAIAQKGDRTTLDARCGVTTVWYRDYRDSVAVDGAKTAEQRTAEQKTTEPREPEPIPPPAVAPNNPYR
jgi:hypothetical protein